jgi:hypothetical protein
MISTATTFGVSCFSCVLSGAVLGSLLRKVVPVNHLNGDAKDVIKLGIGLVGTIVSIVLGMMIASAKSSYDTQSAELAAMSARIVMVDRGLTYYGPEAHEARVLIRQFVIRLLDTMWSEDYAGLSPDEQTRSDGESIRRSVVQLSPKDEAQRSLQAQAVSILTEIGIMRWLMYEQRVAVPTMVMAILISWLTIIFTAYGLFTPPNVTVFCCLVVFAMTVSGAIFLIGEMYSPYTGIVQVSKVPLQTTLKHMSR